MRKLIILTSLLLATACSKESSSSSSVIAPAEESTTITIAVSTGDIETRIALDEENSTAEAWKFVWVEDEPISAWYSGCSTLETFSMESYDSALSTFTGYAYDASAIRLIHPMDDSEGSVSGNIYTIDISEQDGELGKLYMMSERLVAVDGDGEASTTPEMKHVGGFILLTLKLENAMAETLYEVTEVKLSGVPTTLEVDMTGDFLEEGTTFYDGLNADGVITATLTDKSFEESDEVEIRLNTLPFNYCVGDELEFDITLQINGGVYTTQVIKMNTTDADIAFERSKFNYTTITLDGTTGTIEITDCTISDWANGTESTPNIYTDPE